MHTLLEKIGAVIFSAGLAISSFFGFTPQVQEQPIEEPIEELGRAINPVGGKTYTLYGGGISSADTTITLSSFKIPVSEIPYSMANFGDGVNAKGYVTLEPGSATKQEFVSFTGVTQNSDDTATLTGVSRGLAPVAPYTASTTYAKAHSGGSVVVISNPPQLYEAIYSYIDNATTSGAVDGTVTAKGIYETATGFEAASTTQIGGGNTTAALVLTTLLSTSTGGTARTIPVTNASGKIASSFLGDTGTTTFTGPIVGFGTAPSTTIYSTAGTSTYSVPSNLRWLQVEVVGGGSGGAGYDTDGTECCGNSGGAGGYGKSIYTKEQLGTTSVTLVVGEGGAGGASAGTAIEGTKGNPSKFIRSASNIILANGGSAALTSGVVGGAGGVTTGAQINISGGSGSGRGVGGNTSSGNPFGGSSILGGGSIQYSTNSGSESTPYGYGYGGAGGVDDISYGHGLSGGTGVIIITEYF